MIGNDFDATLQKKKPNVEVLYPTISITDDMQRINDPYEKLEFKDDIDVSPDTDILKNVNELVGWDVYYLRISGQSTRHPANWTGFPIY
jgi:hypothetical protein